MLRSSIVRLVELCTRHAWPVIVLASALAAFWNATAELGVTDKVTTFTASDFGRTLTGNNDGSDHGWGSMHFMLGGADAHASPGDLIRLGMGVPHGIFNKSDQTVKVLFWVSPTQKLYDLFWGIHNMKEQKPEDVVAMAAEYNIHFLPPPPGA